MTAPKTNPKLIHIITNRKLSEYFDNDIYTAIDEVGERYRALHEAASGVFFTDMTDRVKAMHVLYEELQK